jgi:hypothetical protein
MLNEFFKLRNRKNEITFSPTQKTVYFDIVDPILLSFENRGNVYVIYLISHKKIRKTASFLIVKSSYTDLEKVLMEEEPVNILFNRGNDIKEEYIDLRNKKINSEDITLSKAIDKNYIPSDSFYLDKEYPNRVDLDDLKVKVPMLKKVFDIKRERFKLEKSENRDIKTERIRFYTENGKSKHNNTSIAKDIVRENKFQNNVRIYNNLSNNYNIQNKELVDNIEYKDMISAIKKYES